MDPSTRPLQDKPSRVPVRDSTYCTPLNSDFVTSGKGSASFSQVVGKAHRRNDSSIGLPQHQRVEALGAPPTLKHQQRPHSTLLPPPKTRPYNKCKSLSFSKPLKHINPSSIQHYPSTQFKPSTCIACKPPASIDLSRSRVQLPDCDNTKLWAAVRSFAMNERTRKVRERSIPDPEPMRHIIDVGNLDLEAGSNHDSDEGFSHLKSNSDTASGLLQEPSTDDAEQLAHTIRTDISHRMTRGTLSIARFATVLQLILPLPSGQAGIQPRSQPASQSTTSIPNLVLTMQDLLEDRADTNPRSKYYISTVTSLTDSESNRALQGRYDHPSIYSFGLDPRSAFTTKPWPFVLEQIQYPGFYHSLDICAEFLCAVLGNDKDGIATRWKMIAYEKLREQLQAIRQTADGKEDVAKNLHFYGYLFDNMMVEVVVLSAKLLSPNEKSRHRQVSTEVSNAVRSQRSQSQLPKRPVPKREDILKIERKESSGYLPSHTPESRIQLPHSTNAPKSQKKEPIFQFRRLCTLNLGTSHGITQLRKHHYGILRWAHAKYCQFYAQSLNSLVYREVNYHQWTFSDDEMRTFWDDTIVFTEVPAEKHKKQESKLEGETSKGQEQRGRKPNK